jgi:hypothetical protein
VEWFKQEEIRRCFKVRQKVEEKSEDKSLQMAERCRELFTGAENG